MSSPSVCRRGAVDCRAARRRSARGHGPGRWLGVAAVCCAVAAAAQAQDSRVPWSAFSSGAGTSTTATTALTSSVGQPLVGAGAAGSYGLSAGVLASTGSSAPAPGPSPIALDFDPAPGDQRLRTVGGAAAGQVYAVELLAEGAPDNTGWSARLDFSPAALEYQSGSFEPGPLLPGIAVQVEAGDGRVTVGGMLPTSGTAAGGDGLLGRVAFRVLPGFGDSTEVVLSQITFRRPDAQVDERTVHVTGLIARRLVQPALRADFNGDGRVDFGDFFVFADGFGGTDPLLDLDGSGQVDFGDFFAFADQFGQEARGRLIDLAHQRLGLPLTFGLERAFPNPFNSSVTLPYSLPQAARARLEVYDVEGQRVRTLVDAWRAGGRYQAVWDGTDADGRPASTGIYLVRLSAPGVSQVRRVALVK